MNGRPASDLLVGEIPYLRAFAISLCGSPTLADDLVQDTLVKAWAKFDSFQQGTNLRAWLITILRNNFFSIYRKSRREVQDSDGIHAAQIAVRGGQEDNLEMSDFRTALAKLAPAHREALIMIGVTELSYEEAAAVCGVAVGTIKSRVHRARSHLAELLGLTDASEIGQGPVSLSPARKAPSKFAAS